MVGAIVASQSRSGTVGLAAMILVLGAQLLSASPASSSPWRFAGILALPLLPSSYWQRIASITDENLDETGSREARSMLLAESFDAFARAPADRRRRRAVQELQPRRRARRRGARATTSVLQVASELGIAGLAVFLLPGVARAPTRPCRRGGCCVPMHPSPAARHTSAAPVEPVADGEHDLLSLAYRGAVTAALAGWFVCALFASVAYHWTFYYLLALAVAPREYLLARVAAGPRQRRAVAGAHRCRRRGARMSAVVSTLLRGVRQPGSSGSAAGPIAAASWSTRGRR